MVMRPSIPPTRNHRQLSRWINTAGMVDAQGRPVLAAVSATITDTDRKLPGTRLRHIGKGRRGLKLEIRLARQSAPDMLSRDALLFEHTSSETYRRHAEARAWVEKNLHRKGKIK